MTAKLKRLKRGFTLVELMIVVAIVGILAALAIYGVSKYVKNAKTAEARDALGRMAKDATGAYQRESMAPDVMALGSSSGISHRLCSSATAVPSSVPKSEKYQSKPSDWMVSGTSAATLGWSCLKFSMDDPQYFQYDYTAMNETANNGSFSCLAHGDLDGDGVSSTFYIAGGVKQESGTSKLVAVAAPNIGEIQPDE